MSSAAGRSTTSPNCISGDAFSIACACVLFCSVRSVSHSFEFVFISLVDSLAVRAAVRCCVCEPVRITSSSSCSAPRLPWLQLHGACGADSLCSCALFLTFFPCASSVLPLPLFSPSWLPACSLLPRPLLRVRASALACHARWFVCKFTKSKSVMCILSVRSWLRV